VGIFAPDSCGTVIDLDLTVKRRDPNAPSALRLMMSGVLAATDTRANRTDSRFRFFMKQDFGSSQRLFTTA
jgi:hypothetical protein